MQVYKFGGASVSDAERISMVSAILAARSGSKTLVVISAMGKTTNALEAVAQAFYAGDTNGALTLFDEIRKQHLEKVRVLLPDSREQAEAALLDIFTEVEWLLHDKPVRPYDYYYDQIVCAGELMSTLIMSAYFSGQGIVNKWVDVRDVLRTDNTFRDAKVLWDESQKLIIDQLVPEFQHFDVIVLQGFIGATEDNESTTLGREGSDYSAALFANMLGATGLTIWKDVEGVMNADPRLIPDAVLIRELDYDEVIEMAFYGAQVIHPKTIKPLQNKNIPLYVKSFLDATLPGTVIHHRKVSQLPPIIVFKRNQVLIHLHSRDYSFAVGKPLMQLHGLLDEMHLQANLIQTGAVKIDLCTDEKADRIEKLALSASDIFDVQVEKGLTLITVRHYTEELIERFTGDKQIMLMQQSPETVQLLVRD